MGDRLRADAGFIIVWILATMVGFFAGANGGVVAAYAFSTGPTPLFAMPLIVYVWSGVGVAAGLLQWVVLRMRLQMAVWWVPTTFLGFFSGSVASISFGAGPIALLAIPFSVGMLQSLVLRCNRLMAAGWWLGANVVGFVIGYGLAPVWQRFFSPIGSPEQSIFNFVVSMSLGVALVTGPAMAWLLRAIPRGVLQ